MGQFGFSMLKQGLFAITLAVVPLAGCSTGNMSTYGGNPSQVASIPNIDALDASTALTQARGHFQNSDFGYSAALYKRVVELSPKNPEGYIGLGASYDRLRRFDLSDRVYASLFKLSGGTAQYYNNLGYSYMLRGDLANALANFKKAQRLDPDNVVVANNLKILAGASRSA